MNPTEYWTNNKELRHLHPVDNRYPEDGLFNALREACSGKVLEIGCGDGRLSPVFEPDKYIGQDINPHALNAARISNPDYCYSFDWQGADTILAYTVLLHVPDVDIIKMLERMKGYKRIVIGEILGRKWRTAGEPPVFNRELFEYETVLGPVSRVIYVWYPHYNTYLSLCVWE